MSYDEEMDVMTIVFVECSWRVVYTGTRVELLLHPRSDTVIGVKICGWKALLEHAKR